MSSVLASPALTYTALKPPRLSNIPVDQASYHAVVMDTLHLYKPTFGLLTTAVGLRNSGNANRMHMDGDIPNVPQLHG